MQKIGDRSGVTLIVLSEVFLVLPATALVAIAGLRLLQPCQHEPARTFWAISEWAATHISHTGAAVLFLAMPALALILGLVSLIRNWRDSGLSQDVTTLITLLRRNMSMYLVMTTTLLASAVLALALVHIIAD